MMWWAWRCRVGPSSGCSPGRGRSARPIGPRRPGVAGVRTLGDEVPVRLILKITVHTAAHDNRSKSSTEGVPSTGVALSPVWAGLQIHEDGHRGHPAGVVLAAAALGHVGRGISAALGRSGGAVGVRGRVNMPGFRPGIAPSTSSSIPVIAHIPFARADNLRDPFGALPIQREVQVGGVVGLSDNSVAPGTSDASVISPGRRSRPLLGEVIDRRVGQDLIRIQPEILPAAHASLTVGRSQALAVFTIPTPPPPGIGGDRHQGPSGCLRPAPGNPRRYPLAPPDRSGCLDAVPQPCGVSHRRGAIPPHTAGQGPAAHLYRR